MNQRTRNAALALFQQERDPASTAPLRNVYKYSLFNLNNDDNYNILTNYEGSTVIQPFSSRSVEPSDSSTIIDIDGNPIDISDVSQLIQLLEDHITNRIMHITSEERNRWDQNGVDSFVVDSERLIF